MSRCTATAAAGEGCELQHTACHQALRCGARQANQATWLHLAAMNSRADSHLPMVQTLLARGLHVDARDKNQYTPLFCATANENTQLAQCLIEEGGCFLADSTLEDLWSLSIPDSH